jgi:3-hydroxyacyl-[acyl-carrier-protein] dehydratase
MRFYLVDRITEMELGKHIEGQKCWSISDDVFNDHFPGFPVVPGVLAIESMAQLLGTLVEKSHQQQFADEHGVYAILSIVHKAKFKKFLIPGDKAMMTGVLTALHKENASGIVEIKVDGQFVAKAELTFMLISKKGLPNERLSQMRDEYFHIITQGYKKRDSN